MNPNAKPTKSKLPSHFNVAVDVVALTIKRGLLQVAVVQRHGDISCIVDKRTGRASEVTRQDIDFALPGGRVEEIDQTLSHAAQRELHEETSITIDAKDLIQIGAYGDRGRDPRPGRTVSVAFVALSPEFGLPFAGSDAERAQFVDVVEILSPPNRLEFDHGQIIRDAITTVRDLMERTPVALKLCGKEFTMSELRHVYEVIFHHAYNPDANFERYAERIRREDEKFGSKVFDDQIKSLSRAVGFSSRGEDSLSLPFSDVGMRLSSGRKATRDMDVLSKVQNLLAEEYRRNSETLGRGEQSAREKLRLHFDPANFTRKAEFIPGFVEKIPNKTKSPASGTGKPAQVYRGGKAERLDPPLNIPRRASSSGKKTTK